MQEIRIGIIGVGNMGGAHAKTIFEGSVPGLRLAALCDTDPVRRELLRAAYPVPVYPAADAMLASAGLDAVIVAAPHYFHSVLAEQALDAGCHVLVEKPMDVRLSSAQALAEKAKASGKVFAIMFNQRTNPLFRRTKEIVAGGGLGKIKKSVWIITNWYRTQAYYDSGSWRASWRGEGGGVLMNQAPHQLDLWQWILGMPSAVTAYGTVAKYHRIEVEDDATIVAEYPEGGIGVFTTSTGEFPGTNRLEISGTRGKLVLEDGALKLWTLEEDEEEFRFSSPQSFARIPYTYTEEKQTEPENGHLNILKNFAAAIRGEEALISPGSDGLCELTLANAAYLSMWTGRRVPLPVDTAAYNAELDRRIADSRVHEAAGAEQLPAGYSERWQVRW